MSTEIWAGEVGPTYHATRDGLVEGEPPTDPNAQSATVTDVDTDNKVVTVETAPTEDAVDSIEDAAMKFTQLLPFVKKLSQALSIRSLSRVNHAMAEFPLGREMPKFKNGSERQLFQVLQELQNYKNTIVTDILTKRNAIAQAEKEKEETINE